MNVRYREGLEDILKNINIKIKDKEKIGVIGRTGSGKSSLLLSFLRITEIREGSIFIN